MPGICINFLEVFLDLKHSNLSCSCFLLNTHLIFIVFLFVLLALDLGIGSHEICFLKFSTLAIADSLRCFASSLLKAPLMSFGPFCGQTSTLLQMSVLDPHISQKFNYILQDVQ